MSTTTFNHSIAKNYKESISGTSILAKFINWCEGQEKNRFAWLGAALAGHGCVLTPLTIFAVVSAGNSMALFMVALLAMAIVLITNLAALSTKITIPVFVLSILIDLGILISTVVMGFSVV